MTAQPENQPASPSTLLSQFATLTEVVLELDRDGRDLSIAKERSPMCGRSPAGLIGRNLKEIISAEEAEFFRQHAQRSQTDGRMHAVRYRVLVGGEEAWFDGWVLPIPDHAVLWITTNVTEFRLAENRLRQKLRFVESLLESCGVGIFAVDSDGACTFVNRAAADMLQHSRENLLGSNLHQVIHHTRTDGKPYPQAECPISTVRRTGQPLRGQDERFFRADGTRFPVEFSAHPIRREGTWEGMVVTFTDITEHKQTEERLLQTAKLESLVLLAGGIAHDFNNILTSIIGNTTLVMEALQPQGRNRHRLAEVVRSSERASDLTRQMLAYAGKGQFLVSPVDISECILNIAERLRASVPIDARLEFQLSPNLPKLLADAQQIHQLVFNLVINAGEATEGCAGAVRVVTSVRDLAEPLAGEAPFGVIPPGRYICLVVADNGNGIDAALRGRIFDPFFSTKFAGRGLGLSAAMGIVRAHHGAIKVESEPGKGSRFEVLLPAEPTSDA
jgi:PAS domain S-box-containing protein